MNPRSVIATVCLLLLLAANTACGGEPIVASTKLPSTTPWNLKQLSEPPAVEWLDSQGTVRSLLYVNEPYGGNPTRVFAYYATPGSLAGDPSRDKQLPAMVLIHGGGGTAFREWAELWAKRGYAAIAMDLAGQRPVEGENPHKPENRTRLPDGGPGQGDDEKFGSIDKPPAEQWPYHAVAAALRAHSLIRSFPEVDPERTAVTGISWGGYLTCIVAGVDSRFKAAVPVYGCGFLHENSAWVNRLAKMSPEQRDRWIALWDPSRYLPAVSKPIFFVNGTNDFAYPLDSYMKSLDSVPGSKLVRVTVNMPHGHPPGWTPREIGLFVDQHLRDGSTLPTIGDPKIDGNQVRASYSNRVELKQAALHFTTGSEPINMRTWQTVPAMIESGMVTAAGLPAEVTAWFITLTDTREATISSRVVLNPSK